MTTLLERNSFGKLFKTSYPTLVPQDGGPMPGQPPHCLKSLKCRHPIQTAIELHMTEFLMLLNLRVSLPPACPLMFC